MAGPEPILILQMQRMGDLILSYPLMLWLARQYPGHPVWVVAEPAFYDQLVPISPHVFYIPWERAGDHLRGRRFRMIVNLSIRDEAARLCGELDAGEKYGPLYENGVRRIGGQWQLYRASLVRNNRYNRFHWADLNALDVIGLARIKKTKYDPPRVPERAPQAGLFLGASQPGKRPSPEFWAGLLDELVKRSVKPVLFGGPAEKDLGRRVLDLFKRPVANFCGTLPLSGLAKSLSTCSVFVTPDTGPMHLAAWTGCKVLNLSLGNVDPWETGPYPPGHVILRADLDCADGCWECTRDRLYCHDPLDPEKTAFVIARLCSGSPPASPPPGLRMYSSTRDGSGLYRLAPHGGPSLPSDALGDFWQTWFGWRFGLWAEERARAARSRMLSDAPLAAEAMADAMPSMIRTLKAEMRKSCGQGLYDLSPPVLRPLTGFADLYLQNRDYAPRAFSELLVWLEELRELTA